MVASVAWVHTDYNPSGKCKKFRYWPADWVPHEVYIQRASVSQPSVLSRGYTSLASAANDVYPMCGDFWRGKILTARGFCGARLRGSARVVPLSVER
eukprot:6737467-Pyramimonas_sp.AAC.1